MYYFVKYQFLECFGRSRRRIAIQPNDAGSSIAPFPHTLIPRIRIRSRGRVHLRHFVTHLKFRSVTSSDNALLLSRNRRTRSEPPTAAYHLAKFTTSQPSGVSTTIPVSLMLRSALTRIASLILNSHASCGTGSSRPSWLYSLATSNNWINRLNSQSDIIPILGSSSISIYSFIQVYFMKISL